MKKIKILLLLTLIMLTVACGPVKPSEDASVVETAEAVTLFKTAVEGPINIIDESNWTDSKIPTTIKVGDSKIDAVIKQRSKEFTYKGDGSIGKTTFKVDVEFDGISYDHYRRDIAPSGDVHIKGDVTKVADGKKQYLYFKDVQRDKSGTVTGEVWYTTTSGKTVRVKASAIF